MAVPHWQSRDDDADDDDDDNDGVEFDDGKYSNQPTSC